MLCGHDASGANCRRLCGPAIADCHATGLKRRVCRHELIRQCREEGDGICVFVTTTTTTSPVNESTTSTRTTTTTTQPVCGDGVCNGTETCSTCCQDCGTCPAVCGNGVCEAGETLATCPADCEPTRVVTLPIAFFASKLGQCSAGTSFFFPEGPAQAGCFSGMAGSLTFAQLLTILPSECGGSPPNIAGGTGINVVCGILTPVLYAIGNCVDQGIRDYVVPVVTSGSYNDPVPVAYFTAIHINSVGFDDFGNFGIDFTQICPQCGEGTCSDGDTCSNCAADCGGCPATCP